MEKVTAVRLRKNLGEYLSRTLLTGENFMIERAGKPIAVLISIQELESLKKIAKDKALTFLDDIKDDNISLSDDSIEEISIEAVRQYRREK